MPIFVLLVFVGAALLWLLLSFGFIPIGKLSNRLLKDASDAMSKDEKDEKILRSDFITRNGTRNEYDCFCN
mgnify:CR=1 FL=1